MAAKDALAVGWRRVSDGHPCAFCAMLASRGFVYHTAETAGSMNRYHNDCRCEIVPGFDDELREVRSNQVRGAW